MKRVDGESVRRLAELATQSGGSQWEKGRSQRAAENRPQKPKEPTNLDRKHSGDSFVTIQPRLPSQYHLLLRVHSSCRVISRPGLSSRAPHLAGKRRSSILLLSQEEVVTTDTTPQNYA